MNTFSNTLLAPLLLFCASILPLTFVQVVPAQQTGDSRPDIALQTPNPPARNIAQEVWQSAAFQRQIAESYVSEVDIEPRITAQERDQMIKVLELITAEKMEEAARLIEKNRNPASSAVFDFTLANIHFQQDRLDTAADIYRVAVQKYPKFRRAWRNLGLIHVRQGQHEPAVEALTRVIELGGGDAILYGLLGFVYSNLENHISAESAYRMANMLDPKSLDWKMGMARAFFRQERFADAAALCSVLLDASPDNADMWMLQANAYIGLNQPMRAAENYEIIEKLGRSTTDSMNMLADIYVNEGLFELAVVWYIRALERDAEAKADRALRAARVLTARNALSETRMLVERVEELRGELLDEPDRKDLLKLRARIAVAEGAGEEEARILEEIVALDPLDGEALILLGQHAGRGGDHEKAIFYYERAASIERFEADAKVRHAQLLVGLGKYEEALPLLRRAQTINPRSNVQQYLEQVERVARSR